MDLNNKLTQYLLAFGAVSFVVVILFEYIIMPMYTRHNTGQYLMDVQGKTLEEAIAMIEAEDFRAIVSDTMYTNKVAEGIVVDQYPKPNMKVKTGRTVRLKISTSEKLVFIPNLIGQSLRSAELVLQQAGLLIDTVYSEYNPEYPKGTIAWQYPKANNTMKKGFGIQVTLSKGLPPDFYQVPNVIGLSLNQAKEYLAKARLKVGKISYHEDQDLVPYTVLDQSISEGTVLDRPMNINLVVSVLDLQDIFNQLTNEP
jgi:serine/threonine-protein kinase|tara:strand:+ start:1100 stop:1867 length:768 start_codon:yes stop_codon:yes gene_type:complete